MLKYIVFDFDGTLADTYSQIIKIAEKIAKEEKVADFDFNEVKKEGIRSLIKKLKIPAWKIPSFIYRGKSHLKKEDIRIFPAMLEILKTLKNKYSLGIVSSNSAENIEKILKKYGVDGLFSFVYSDSSIFGKHLVLKRMYKKYGLDPKEIIYVADEDRDIDAARKAGIKIIAVSWGFNSSEILQKHQPDYLIASPSQIWDILK